MASIKDKIETIVIAAIVVGSPLALYMLWSWRIGMVYGL